MTVYGYDVNSITNFQAESFAGGSFSYCYDDRVVDYAPVFPFDWDNDGLENSVDPDPLAAGPDAHGTNAEWYDFVCSNVLTAVDGATGTTGVPPVEIVNGQDARSPSVNGQDARCPSLRAAHDALRAKLLPQIYSLGFLNPDVEYFV